MGYSFYLISKEKEITQDDYDTAISNLSKFNRLGYIGHPPCRRFYFESDDVFIRFGL